MCYNVTIITSFFMAYDGSGVERAQLDVEARREQAALRLKLTELRDLFQRGSRGDDLKTLAENRGITLATLQRPELQRLLEQQLGGSKDTIIRELESATQKTEAAMLAARLNQTEHVAGEAQAARERIKTASRKVFDEFIDDPATWEGKMSALLHSPDLGNAALATLKDLAGDQPNPLKEQADRQCPDIIPAAQAFLDKRKIFY